MSALTILQETARSPSKYWTRFRLKGRRDGVEPDGLGGGFLNQNGKCPNSDTKSACTPSTVAGTARSDCGEYGPQITSLMETMTAFYWRVFLDTSLASKRGRSCSGIMCASNESVVWEPCMRIAQ